MHPDLKSFAKMEVVVATKVTDIGKVALVVKASGSVPIVLLVYTPNSNGPPVVVLVLTTSNVYVFPIVNPLNVAYSSKK